MFLELDSGYLERCQLNFDSSPTPPLPVASSSLSISLQDSSLLSLILNSSKADIFDDLRSAPLRRSSAADYRCNSTCRHVLLYKIPIISGVHCMFEADILEPIFALKIKIFVSKFRKTNCGTYFGYFHLYRAVFLSKKHK